MKNLFSDPKRAAVIIGGILLCILMAIGGAMMALSMAGAGN